MTWHKPCRVLLVLLMFALAAGGIYAGADFGKMLKTLTSRYGREAAASFLDWHTLVTGNRQRSDLEKLHLANDFFNQRTRFVDDSRAWGRNDFWATPMETLGHRQGDCEDFTIAKYFTLLTMGIPSRQLRLIYVKASGHAALSAPQQAHMVLAYYSSPDDEPLVLDNLIDEIRPASQRPGLSPVFSFNSEGIWAGSGGNATSAGGVGRLSRWQDLLRRAHAEGFRTTSPAD